MILPFYLYFCLAFQLKSVLAFNTFALKAAKTLRSFGRYECNRVKTRPHLSRASSSREANRKSEKSFPFIKLSEKHGDVPILLKKSLMV